MGAKLHRAIGHKSQTHLAEYCKEHQHRSSCSSPSDQQQRQLQSEWSSKICAYVDSARFWPGLYRQEVGQLDKIKVRSQICANFWYLDFNASFRCRFLFCLLPLHPILCILETHTHTHLFRNRRMIQWPLIIGISSEKLSKRLWEKEI